MQEATIAAELKGLKEQFTHFIENDFKELKKDVEKIGPVVEAYDSVVFSKKFLVGVGSVVGSLAAVGAAILWLVDELIKRN